MLNKIWGRGEVFRTCEATTYMFQGYTYMGAYPPKKHRKLYYVYSTFTTLMLCVLIQLFFNMAYFLDRDVMSNSQLMTSLQAAMNIWGMPAKFITMSVYLPHLRLAEQHMCTLDARCTRPEERAKVRDVVLLSNRLLMGYFVMYGVYGAFSFAFALAQGETPFSMYLYFLDRHSSPTQFYQQAVIELVISYFLLYLQALNDSYPVIYIFILRAHMQMLTARVRRLGTNAQLTKKQNYDELVQCIADHQCLLQLHVKVSNVVSITLFVQFLITAGVMGITMINISVFADTSTKLTSVIYFAAVVLQITPTCYQATCLLMDSEDLPLAIFQCNWLVQDIRFRKMLLFFMQRAQSPMTLTAMKLFPITLDTNLSIAKFSFSLYTLIKETGFGQSLK